MVAFQAMGMVGFLMASSPDAATASNSTASTTSSFIFFNVLSTHKKLSSKYSCARKIKGNGFSCIDKLKLFKNYFGCAALYTLGGQS
jgi:hypothetical protein